MHVTTRAVLLIAATQIAATVASPPEFTDIHSVRKAFAGELSRMHEEGEPVAVAPLREQLGDRKCVSVSRTRSWRRKRDADALYRRYQASIVVLGKIFKCGKCSKWHAGIATGFVVGRNGEVVTAYHVLGDDTRSEAIAAQTSDGRMHPVTEVLAYSKVDDLVVLRVPGVTGVTPLPVADPADVGTPVVCISHPVEHYYTMTEGIVSSNFMRPAHGKHEARREMAITADFAKGSSGGPVLDMTGAVVGVVRSTSPVYYEENEGKGDKIQMVWKLCAPSSSLLELISGDGDE